MSEGTITLEGELDAASVDALRQQLTDGSGEITVDMGGVTFVESSILNLLAATAAHRGLVIVNPSRIVQRVLTLSGLDHLLTSHD
jgi:anti-anti-sigma factor